MALDGIFEDFVGRVDALLAQSPAYSRRILDAARHAAKSVDAERLEVLRSYVAENRERIESFEGQWRYLDVAGLIKDKARHIVELNLDRHPQQRILDLGTGGGHFPFIAQSYGHEVVGIDKSSDIYQQILTMYGVPRIEHEIKAYQELPVEGKFDLITALRMMYNFTGVKGPNLYWDFNSWKWWMEHLSSKLRFPGRIFLALNKQPMADGEFQSDYLLDLFERNGAEVDYVKLNVLFRLDRPLELDASKSLAPQTRRPSRAA